MHTQAQNPNAGFNIFCQNLTRPKERKDMDAVSSGAGNQ
jgi:hypothetical protein